jgi:hypothetical protein
MAQLMKVRGRTPSAPWQPTRGGRPVAVLDRYRAGRNWISVGDLVRIDPPTEKTGFLATVDRITEIDGRAEFHVTMKYRLNGDRHPREGWARVFTADRVSRVSKPRADKLLHR